MKCRHEIAQRGIGTFRCPITMSCEKVCQRFEVAVGEAILPPPIQAAWEREYAALRDRQARR